MAGNGGAVMRSAPLVLVACAGCLTAFLLVTSRSPEARPVAEADSATTPGDVVPELVPAPRAEGLPVEDIWAGPWGDIEGQYVFGGEPPEPEVLVAKGADVKDREVCAAQNIGDESLVVDPESRGIANIFVYLRKLPADVHPRLSGVPEEPVLFGPRGCRFVPHVLFARAGQNVGLESGDPVRYVMHTHPLRNHEDIVILQPNERRDIPLVYLQAEPVPMKVVCDFHPHMSSYWLVLDDPYAAVTDAQGRFRIRHLPEGEHRLNVWHERAGYLERRLTVTVTAGETTGLPPVPVAPARFNLAPAKANPVALGQ